MTDIVLTGIDGTNPLGFLASLGTLEVADAVTETTTLAWTDDGYWRPVLRSPLDKAALLAALLEDLGSWRDDPVIAFEYENAKGKLQRDLKPSPERWRDHVGSLQRDPSPLRARRLRMAGALASDVVTDNNGNTKPTAFHFTAGQQQFLDMVRQLVDGVTSDDLEEALFGPWTYERRLPVLQWDSTAARDYALRATDPSADKKTGIPGADWLAFRALGSFPVAPIGQRLHTTGWTGGWKTGRFTWPLWSPHASLTSIRSLLTSPGLPELSASDRSARGICLILVSDVRRSDQGGYGSLCPPHIV